MFDVLAHWANCKTRLLLSIHPKSKRSTVWLPLNRPPHEFNSQQLEFRQCVWKPQTFPWLRFSLRVLVEPAHSRERRTGDKVRKVFCWGNGKVFLPSFAVTARTTAGDASSKTPTCALQTNTDTARPAICMRPRPQACTRRKVTRLSPMARFSNISMKKSVRFLNVFLKQDESNANTIVVIHNNSNTRPTHTHTSMLDDRRKVAASSMQKQTGSGGWGLCGFCSAQGGWHLFSRKTTATPVLRPQANILCTSRSRSLQACHTVVTTSATQPCVAALTLLLERQLIDWLIDRLTILNVKLRKASSTSPRRHRTEIEASSRFQGESNASLFDFPFTTGTRYRTQNYFFFISANVSPMYLFELKKKTAERRPSLQRFILERSFQKKKKCTFL